MTAQSERVARGGIQSVDRAAVVLEFLASAGASTVSAVGQELDVHKSTAFRILNTLLDHGLVEQRADSTEYQLGQGLVRLAQAVPVAHSFSRRVHEACVWLAGECGETVTLNVTEGGESVTIDQILPTTSVVSRSWLGRRTPLHCTSPGKVSLAHQGEALRGQLLAGRLKRYTPATITDRQALARELEATAERGYALALEEFEEGLSSAAAPVYGADGSMIAQIGVAGPSYRLGEDALAAIVVLVQEAGRRASA
ncbi:MAG TPA: IclR family transcriptional regulator [Arthrobacter sp.]|nr:IclR family transcriptional regulator [Arthrobacter sp.]